MIIVRESDIEAAVNAVFECAAHATNASYFRIKLPLDRSLVRKSILAMISVCGEPADFSVNCMMENSQLIAHRPDGTQIEFPPVSRRIDA